MRTAASVATWCALSGATCVPASHRPRRASPPVRGSLAQDRIRTSNSGRKHRPYVRRRPLRLAAAVSGVLRLVWRLLLMPLYTLVLLARTTRLARTGVHGP